MKQTKYRQLKSLYEGVIGKQISDVTWYRIVGGMKKNLFFDVHADFQRTKQTVEYIAKIKANCPAFSFRNKNFQYRWEAFKYFYELGIEKCTSHQFWKLVESYFQIEESEIPRSTKYYFFTQAGLRLTTGGDYYQLKDLALAAFIVAQWVKNKQIEEEKETYENIEQSVQEAIETYAIALKK